LNLDTNFLTSCDLGNNVHLKELSICYNNIQELFLPVSLELLRTDRDAAIKYDFKDQVNLEELWIFGKEETKR
jgi:hypothetical protein